MYPKEKILEYGYPANDPLYAPDREERARKIKEKLGIPADKKVIMYAPTWRDDNYYEIGQFKFDLDLDVNRLEKEFGDEYVLLLRLHYLVVEALDMSKYGKFAVNGSAYDDVTDLYLITDILITDYSSVFFDYANLKRPIVFFMADYDEYKNKTRDFYFDVKELPGPVVFNQQETMAYVKKFIDNFVIDDKYKKFNEKYNYLDGPDVSKKVLDMIIEN